MFHGHQICVMCLALFRLAFIIHSSALRIKKKSAILCTFMITYRKLTYCSQVMQMLKQVLHSVTKRCTTPAVYSDTLVSSPSMWNWTIALQKTVVYIGIFFESVNPHLGPVS